ncbi:DUF2304 domain-containing protein [Priestia megaterium]|uniref:DUF2304 domain-containing protein n=1 Tax=Priestia megaterium (strain ATCC 14581 / DSM 32 / CCUG 1817 / JCM 2506 / NBRC 15308 / NCIMB 9376 / NCTC 10342 / NRRL B-14308 / VKM B-512 / Ford 19) TaxID=1348623 RepID=A0A0B6AHY3_PRIM2|nr:DUF2304 domain-containing protein [Priestia megaterium]AJI20223.1 hypothetical protein BG04_2215 [Priestia megaterium NBRC 15308 = ATCC 14581]KFN06646.1 hypothetical protein DJ91_4562 [Priestia megaterium]KGJ85110.1 hypothetical protein BMT_02055 [Priestia megaterium NBRC 15308 = ATCC 14581]MDR4233513.1 DUF2304 domain-containing protein [Priestia megaterium]MED3806984.1 DUF2304 domain-containing protein [Priestia megaterium]
MTPVQIISLVVALIFLFQVLVYTSKHKLKDQVAFFWLLISLAGVIIAISLPFFNVLVSKIGIYYMPSLFFLLALILILNILIYQNVLISKQQDKIKDLTQEMALLKHSIQEKERNL